MTVTIYKDADANAIFVEGPNGPQFLNSLQATVPPGTDTCTVVDLVRDINAVSDTDYTEFVDQNGDAWGNTAVEVCNNLNAEFSISGTPLTNLPVITSSLAISSVQGSPINYELTADYAVGYEWDLSSVPGITTVEGNPRKLVGGSGLTSATYNIPVKAINYNGEDSETLVLTVSSPSFANTKSVNFNNNDYLGANAALLDGILGRASNGAGSGDAWSVSFYFKPGTASNANQTILYFGAQDVANNGQLQIKYSGASTAENLVVRYGSNNNRLELTTPAYSLTSGTWHHVLVVYDGGTTGSSSGSINSYYGRFSVYIDGVSQSLLGSQQNYGYTGSISGQNFRVGRWNNGQSLRNNCRVDELAIFEGDQSSVVADIYNSGVPFDLSTLTDPPDHWWRMGDGDSYPNLQDNGTQANCTFVMYNMTSADIVNDVP
jgi:hypothetical protein